MLSISLILRPSSSIVAVSRSQPSPLSSCRCPAVEDTTCPFSSIRKRTPRSLSRRRSTTPSFGSWPSVQASSVSYIINPSLWYSLCLQPVLQDLLPLWYHCETLDPNLVVYLRAPESTHVSLLRCRLVLPTWIPQNSENRFDLWLWAMIIHVFSMIITSLTFI